MLTDEELDEMFASMPREESHEVKLRRAYPRGIEKHHMDFEVPAHADILAHVAQKLGVEPERVKANQDRFTDELLGKHLTPGEQAQLVNEVGANYSYRKGVEESNPAQHLFFKIENSAWRWGYGRLTWKQVARYYRFLQDFHFGDGFEVTVDYTTGCNQRGLVWLQRTIENHCYVGKIPYIDGTIGLFVWHKGRHVMTIGVSPTANGLLVHQVQLAEKRGNRWLYKLGAPYFEYTLSRVRSAAAKHQIRVHLTTGDYATQQIAEGYGDSELRAAFLADRARVAAIYDQPLETLRRTEPRNKWKGKFWTLSRA